MQIQWHGRDGYRGQDKSLMTIPIEVASDKVTGRNLVLKAGINDGVDPDDWEIAKKNLTVQKYMEMGHLEEVSAETLGDFKEPRAIQMTKETIDLNLLNKWRKSETRPKVVEAIDKQLREMMTLPVAKPPNDHNSKPSSAGGAPVATTATQPLPQPSVPPTQPWQRPPPVEPEGEQE